MGGLRSVDPSLASALSTTCGSTLHHFIPFQHFLSLSLSPPFKIHHMWYLSMAHLLPCLPCVFSAFSSPPVKTSSLPGYHLTQGLCTCHPPHAPLSACSFPISLSPTHILASRGSTLPAGSPPCLEFTPWPLLDSGEVNAP